MSGVLQRLVARATGAERAGVQARLPARFEAGGMAEDGFSERVDEVAAPRRAREEAAPLPVREARGEEPVFEERRDDPEAVPPSPEVPRQEARVKVTREAPDEGRQPIAERLGEAETPASPAPLLSTTERTVERVVVEERSVAAAEPPRARAERYAPPAPLLPPEPGRSALAPLPAPHVPARRVERQAEAREAPAPQPPEISIHIGRIEVRGEAEKPAPRKRAPREVKLASLSDYLGGGAS